MDNVRLHSEYILLKALEAASGGRVAVEASTNKRQYTITLNFKAPVGTDEHYTMASSHKLKIHLPDTFPAANPILAFERPVFAPNIWTTGSVCIVGQGWFPARTLAEVVCDVVDTAQWVEPNLSSAANGAAARAYQKAEFLADLRRKIGPPVRLAAPLPHRDMGITTVAASGTAGISSVARRAAALSP
jgi:ubiquitin-protein ligase